MTTDRVDPFAAPTTRRTPTTTASHSHPSTSHQEPGDRGLSDRDVYVERMKMKLDTWNEELDALEASATKAADTMREALNARVRTMREKRRSLEHRLNVLKASSEAAWGDVREGVDAAWTQLRQSLSDARSHFDMP